MCGSRKPLVALVLCATGLVAWLASGFYTLSSGEQALVLRWGKAIALEVEPGVQFHWPRPIEQIKRARVSELHSLPFQADTSGRELITGDENLMMVSAILSYDIVDLDRSLFGVQELDRLLRAAGQECLCRELAAVDVDMAMTGGQPVLRRAVREGVQALANSLGLGVRIISVELAEMSPPATVAEAFQRVASARVRKQETVQEARGYAGSIVPRSRGEARSLVAAAEASAREQLERARGDSASFVRLAAEYHRSPEITAHLQWLKTLSGIFERSQVRIDTQPAHSVYYLRFERPTSQEEASHRRIGPPPPQERTNND